METLGLKENRKPKDDMVSHSAKGTIPDVEESKGCGHEPGLLYSLCGRLMFSKDLNKLSTYGLQWK